MLKEAHVHARFTVQVDGNHITKEDIKKAFDDKATDMLNGGRILTLSGEATNVIDESEIYKTETDYKFVHLTLREGEREFDITATASVDANASQDEIFDQVIKSMFGEPVGITDRGEYEYDGGEYVIYGGRLIDMTKNEFDIVGKFV